ncbi:MAG: hypothetical protein IT270_10725 [Saprospiraceae bacterium]|nr:hypothetical protein [Saprospiraceae bacterium]
MAKFQVLSLGVLKHKISMTSSLILRIALGFLLFPSTFLVAQNIGINADGSLPDPNAILDISSTTSGLLIPRMTTAQRDAIVTPPIGLQVFNLSTNTLDLYTSTGWSAALFTESASNLVYVYSLADLPAPSGGAILLDATKMYVFSGFVNISANYLNLNGAGLRGTDPEKDGVMSTVSGGILRSTGVSVFIENLAVIPASGSTKAYDFADATGTKFCNLFSGCSVVEIGTPSLGVGQISGFKAATINKNYWKCSDGVKVTGNMGKFASALNFITGISAGSGIEFLAGLTIDDIDLSNNYFVYTGQTGVKVNAGSTITHGRMTTNMFRGVSTLLSGFDSYSFGWQMQQNTGIPNTRAFAFEFMDGNTTPTIFGAQGVFTKILGTTTQVSTKKFTASSNRFTYIGKSPIDARVLVVVGANSPTSSSDDTIVIAKNNVVIPAPTSSLGPLINNQGFQIVLETEVSLSTNDYIEVFIKSNIGTNSLVVKDFQFRVVE